MRKCYSIRRLSYLLLVFMAYKFFTWILLLHPAVHHTKLDINIAGMTQPPATHEFYQLKERDEPLQPPEHNYRQESEEQHAAYVEGQPKTVLLLSYQRSGSTFIGNVVLMNNPDVYYVYEPLDGPYCAMYGTQPGMNIPDDIHNFENGSHRELPAYELDMMRKTLVNTFNCNTKSSPLQMALHKFWEFFSYNMEKIQPYATCLKRKRMTYRSAERCRGYIRKVCGKRFSANNSSSSVCLQRLWFNRTVADPLLETNFVKYQTCMKNIAKRLHECRNLPDKACSANDVRAVKTVRATMENIKPFFTDLPNFRVVHLIRDPRAAVASKRRLWWAQGSYAQDNVTKEAIIYCKGIARDLRMRKELERKYPGRILEVIYDDFVQKPMESIQRLYSFLELNLHNTTVEKLQKATANSTHAATKWQSQLTYLEAKSIEEQCQEVYQGVSFQWTS